MHVLNLILTLSSLDKCAAYNIHCETTTERLVYGNLLGGSGYLPATYSCLFEHFPLAISTHPSLYCFN